MTNPNDVDVNALIKIYNQKISTLTNQNILLEAKLQTIVQDHLDAQKELLAEKLEIQEKYENLLSVLISHLDSRKGLEFIQIGNDDDLKTNIGNIFIGYTIDKKPVYARDLKAENAMAILLKDAIQPNLVQTLEGNAAIIHGGPFANIAQGTNTILATKMGLTLGDYVVTEAGFGADLGAEKFLNIKCVNL